MRGLSTPPLTVLIYLAYLMLPSLVSSQCKLHDTCGGGRCWKLLWGCWLTHDEASTRCDTEYGGLATHLTPTFVTILAEAFNSGPANSDNTFWTDGDVISNANKTARWTDGTVFTYDSNPFSNGLCIRIAADVTNPTLQAFTCTSGLQAICDIASQPATTAETTTAGTTTEATTSQATTEPETTATTAADTTITTAAITSTTSSVPGPPNTTITTEAESATPTATSPHVSEEPTYSTYSSPTISTTEDATATASSAENPTTTSNTETPTSSVSTPVGTTTPAVTSQSAANISKPATAAVNTTENTTTALTTISSTSSATSASIISTTAEMTTGVTTSPTTAVAKTDQVTTTTDEETTATMMTTTTTDIPLTNESSTISEATMNTTFQNVEGSTSNKMLCYCKTCPTTTVTPPPTINMEQLPLSEFKPSNKRKGETRPDNRPSAVAIGSVGVGVLVAVAAIIIIPDLPRIFSDVRHAIRHRCCHGNDTDLESAQERRTG